MHIIHGNVIDQIVNPIEGDLRGGGGGMAMDANATQTIHIRALRQGKTSKYIQDKQRSRTCKDHSPRYRLLFTPLRSILGRL